MFFLLLILIFNWLFAFSHAIIVSKLGSPSPNSTTTSMCLDTFEFNMSNNGGGWIRQWVPCPMVYSSRNTTVAVETTTKVATSIINNNITTTNISKSNTIKKRTHSYFDITFQCLHGSPETCNKVRRAFEKAGDIISKVILFKEPVKVNATLASFCQLNNDCNRKLVTLGGSCPSRSIPLLNKDGVFRLHPQALVKQFELGDDRPKFTPFDIVSVFNVDAPFWFEEDQIPINSKQADFMFVILHEFMHGLGFYSGWNQYLPDRHIVTPDPSPLLTDQFILTINPTSNAIHPTKFIESAMDRLIYILPLNNLPLSNLTRHINRIQSNNIDELIDSPEFQPIVEFNNLLTTPFALGIKTSTASDDNRNDELMILETGLQPFRPGSSISHLAFQKYTQHPEFLMRYKQDRGMTLTEVLQRGSGSHPIGPFLLKIFEELGYSTVNNPNVVPPLFLKTKEISKHFVAHETNSVQRSQANVFSRDSFSCFYLIFVLLLLVLLSFIL